MRQVKGAINGAVRSVIETAICRQALESRELVGMPGVHVRLVLWHVAEELSQRLPEAERESFMNNCGVGGR